MAVFHDPINPVDKTKYFIKKLFHILEVTGTRREKVDSLRPEDLAAISNTFIHATQTTDEGRKCQGNVCFVPEPLLETVPRFRLLQRIPFTPETIVSVLLASARMAAVLSWDRATSTAYFHGFCEHESARRYLCFDIHRKRGLSVSLDRRLIAAITPGAVLTPRSATNQEASYDNLEYMVRRTLYTDAGLDPVDAIIQKRLRALLLIRVMRGIWAQGQGGCLFVVPEAKDALAIASIKHGFDDEENGFGTAYRGLLRSLAEKRDDLAPRAMNARHFFDWVAETSRVDGAIVMDSRTVSLLGFGAKIHTMTPTHKVSVVDAIGTSATYESEIAALGGTRHQSAASAVVKIPASFAFVCSTDGSAKLITNHPLEGRVVVYTNIQYCFEFPPEEDLLRRYFDFGVYLTEDVMLERRV